MRRTHILIGFIATLALFSALFVATAVLGHTKRTVVRDALNPNRAGSCDIRKATAQIVKRGRVARHTVTVRGALPFDNAAAFVYLTKGRTSDLFGEPAALLHPTSDGDYHFADHRRTVIYTIHKRDLPRAFSKRKRYFWWAATSCGGTSGDDAPNSGRKRQVLKRHDHR